MGAPSGFNAFKAAKRAVAAFGLMLERRCFPISALDGIQLALLVLHRRQHAVAAVIERTEEETKVDVEQEDEAHRY